MEDKSMKRGRPLQSEIRQNMIEILHVLSEAYGYQIYKTYKEVYPSVTLRSMYYHLKKGKKLGEFEVVKVEKDQGSFSWGPSTERIIYKLGPAAKPKGDQRLKDYAKR
jgi:hypothetical protein